MSLSRGIIEDSYKPPTTPFAGMAAWYDASDASTFTYSSSTVVSQWRDKSGASRHLNQASVPAQPNRNGTQNGRATVVFDGVDDNLQTAAPVSTAIDNVTMMVAAKRTGGSATDCIPFFNGNPAGNGYGAALRASGATFGMLRGGISWHGSSFTDTGLFYCMTLRRTAGNWQLFINRFDVSLNFPTDTPNAPAGTSMMPSTFHQFGGPIGEVLFYAAALSETQRSYNENYLRYKWGLA